MSRTLACRDHILDALIAEMAHRHDDPGLGWIDRERQAVADAATAWATAHGIDRTVTVDDVERIEGPAVGHIDYAQKLSWYVAEFVTNGTVEVRP